MEKQHNRGQDGAGFASVKFNVEPGTRILVEFALINRNQYKMFLPK